MTADTNTTVQGIRNDPFVKGMLKRLPTEQRSSFSEEQLLGLKVALGARTWGTHRIDLRWTMKLWKKSYYIVIIAGVNRRSPSRRQQKLARLGKAIFLATLFLILSVFSLLLLYIIKSALGIDLIDNFSLGIWSAIKNLVNGGLY